MTAVRCAGAGALHGGPMVPGDGRRPGPDGGGEGSPSGDQQEHWSRQQREAVVTATGPEPSVPIEGGSDHGQLSKVGPGPPRQLLVLSGRLIPGELIIKVQGKNVCGYTRFDIEEWLETLLSRRRQLRAGHRPRTR